ncbi:MAG: hypothetical protein HY315_10400 [Acidobacteria bacterium]|nr:hypothetical protein [Acidobacteriota bacterium]
MNRTRVSQNLCAHRRMTLACAASVWLCALASASAESRRLPDYPALAEGLIYELLTSLWSQSAGPASFRELRVTERLGRRQRVTQVQQAEYQWQIDGKQRRIHRLSANATPGWEDFQTVQGTALRPRWSLEQWRALYDFRVTTAGAAEADGPVLGIEFSPKRNQPALRGKLERVLGSLSGEVQYTPGQPGRIRLLAHLRQPVRFHFWLGAVTRLEIELLLLNRAGRWLPESFHFEIRFRERFRSFWIREQRRYRDFEVSESESSVRPGR